MKPTMSITQSSILHFMRDFGANEGMLPTQAEIAAHFGWKSANAAFEHVHCLANKGYTPSFIALPVIDPSKVLDFARARAAT